MNVFVLAFFGGILGAVLMDITETAMARVGVCSGVNVALVGRWLPCEAGVGWAFHFLVGGGAVALIYPLAVLSLGVSDPLPPILGGLLFGVLTSLLPWFVLLPAFGWGWFGRRGPRGANALLASPLSHIPYGLGVGTVMALGSTLG
jgi:Protein of unknown function (DUF2938)